MTTIAMTLRSISSQTTESSKPEDLTHVLYLSQNPSGGANMPAMVPQVASMTVPMTRDQAEKFVIGNEYSVTIE